MTLEFYAVRSLNPKILWLYDSKPTYFIHSTTKNKIWEGVVKMSLLDYKFQIDSENEPIKITINIEDGTEITANI